MNGVKAVARSTLRLSWPLQEEMVGLAFDLLDPRWIGGALRRSMAAARVLVEGGSVAALLELVNKAEVYLLVEEVPRELGVSAQGPFPLHAFVERAYTLGPFPALWAVEGLGHEYADSYWQQGLVAEGLLRSERGGTLPVESLLMLHAGIGLSFAQRRLESADSHPPPGLLRGLVGSILDLSRSNSRPGYSRAAIESLGLVTRTFRPDLVAPIDYVLRRQEPDEVVGLFWHGVGRAIYFLPVNFLPCAAGTLFETVDRDAPDELARLNLRAGLAWAAVLVNQRQPSVLAELLIRPYARELARDDAFANGVAAATVVRAESTPNSELISDLIAFEPAPDLEGPWEQLVREPSRRAVDTYRPVLAKRDRLDEVFRYQDLAALCARLSGRTGS